jgi:NDP-sugar pyrophosphorylase family protein
MLKERGERYAAGKRCTIATTATVTESILWDNVTLGHNARVHRCVLGDGVRLSEGEGIDSAVVVRGALIEGKTRPEKAPAGYIRGENYIVPL